MTIEELTLKHFDSTECKEEVMLDIWDVEVRLSPHIHFYKESCDVSPFVEDIKERLICFNQDKSLVLRNLVDEGYLEAVEEWTEDSREEWPISQEELLDSFSPFEVGLSIGDKEDEPIVMVYLDSDVECFSGHVMCCYIKKMDGQMTYAFALEG